MANVTLYYLFMSKAKTSLIRSASGSNRISVHNFVIYIIIMCFALYSFV